MTEELKEQIHERVYNIKVPTLGFSRRDLFNIAIEYAEPREKQIQIDAEHIRALQKQNGELTDKVADLEETVDKLRAQFALRYNLEDKIKDLESQIEKMKSDVISERDKALLVEDVITYTVLNDVIDKWGIRK